MPEANAKPETTKSETKGSQPQGKTLEARVAELEAKLAESEKAAQELKTALDMQQGMLREAAQIIQAQRAAAPPADAAEPATPPRPIAEPKGLDLFQVELKGNPLEFVLAESETKAGRVYRGFFGIRESSHELKISRIEARPDDCRPIFVDSLGRIVKNSERSGPIVSSVRISE